MKQDITCVFEGVAGVGGIYISNLKAAQNVQLLNNLNIKAIVTANRNGIIVQHDKSSINDHLYIPADDIETYDLSKHFQETYNFIDLVRKKTNVLVHCYAGISRSATIVIAYLLRKYNYSLDNVITMVKRRREKINPNKGFLEQLKKQAIKMGITSNQNQQPVQEVLRRSSYSVERRRGFSAGNVKKYILNKKQNIGKSNMISLCLNKNKENCEVVGSSNIQNKIDLQINIKENQENIKNESATTGFGLTQKQKEQQLLPQYYSQKLNNQNSDSKTQNPIVEISSPIIKTKEQAFGNPSFKLFQCDKLQKIQRLKARILQSQRRKRSQQKRSNSEINPQKSPIKQAIIQIKPKTPHLNDLVSIKLNHQSIQAKTLHFKTQIKSPLKTDLETGHINRIKILQKQALLS